MAPARLQLEEGEARRFAVSRCPLALQLGLCCRAAANCLSVFTRSRELEVIIIILREPVGILLSSYGLDGHALHPRFPSPSERCEVEEKMCGTKSSTLRPT